ncbi:hypothetical protein FNV43_RR15078 [Rhamnella rubrinervis]|uniref:Uncharacterized protein n=1 Tax=Rhamnella rubrinervis TaxID=2594499 RepID=A0A8K0E0V8_9ROSA|nr:hypothetical protein FNV43_RR15078 [Rhamnella rubrinervis]
MGSQWRLRRLDTGTTGRCIDPVLKMAKAKSLMYTNTLANVDNCRIRVTCRSSLITCIKDILEKFLEDPNKPSRFKRRQLNKFKSSCFVFALHDGELNESATYSLSGFPKAFQVDDELRSAIHSLNVKVDHVANDLNTFRFYSMLEFQDFRLNSMREIQLIKDSFQEMFIYMKNKYHRPNTYENTLMNEEGEIRDKEMNVMQNYSEVQFIIKDEVIDYDIYNVSKEFFWDLVQGEWLNDKCRLRRIHAKGYVVFACKIGIQL